MRYLGAGLLILLLAAACVTETRWRPPEDTAPTRVAQDVGECLSYAQDTHYVPGLTGEVYPVMEGAALARCLDSRGYRRDAR